VVDLSKLLTVAECGKRCAYSEPQLRARIDDGRLKATRIAQAVYIHEDDFAEFPKHAS
jgi:hypothetical protein